MVHCYKLNGYNIIIDVYSGSVHVTDDLSFELIKNYENSEDLINYAKKRFPKESESDIKECISEIEQLKKDGVLFSENPLDKFTFPKKSKTIKALCLHIAHSCNLVCEYCFAAQGKFKGEEALMSFDVAKRVIDFLIENSGSHYNLEVDFFGGEPLLNFDVVKQTVEYARSIEKEKNKNFRFTLTTNGVLLTDEIIDYLNENMYNVVLSLDGRPEIHNHFRKNANGRGSYDISVKNFKKLVEKRKGKNYYIRGTFTHLNPDFLNDIKHMVNLGFDKLSMEPVVSEKDYAYALTDKDKKIVLQNYEELANYMLKQEKLGKKLEFYHYNIDLKNGPCLQKRLKGCGSGSEYFAVTPNGDLYPCHQFVSDKDFKMGNIWSGIDNSKKYDDFLTNDLSKKKECEDCFAKLYCAGGCAANAYHSTKDINGIYEDGCDLFKKRIESAIMMQVDRQFNQ
ncbi:MAG: thioether cross-link-forming SCIFF peptide maturase [Clostridia bacterium]|nr:thioether cross-link-forming SCIFF peptide maturase [Clostridia bacterium]